MRRGRALFLSCLLLLGQAAGLAHVVFVTHITCPEHGDLIHPREGQAAARSESAWYPLPAAAGMEHGDHCATALHQGDRTTCPEPAVAGAPSAAHALPCLGDRAADVIPSALFRLAPKTSPPVRPV